MQSFQQFLHTLPSSHHFTWHRIVAQHLSVGFSICWLSESTDHCLIVTRFLSNSQTTVYLVANKLHLQDTVRREKQSSTNQRNGWIFDYVSISLGYWCQKKEKMVVSRSVSLRYSPCPQLNKWLTFWMVLPNDGNRSKLTSLLSLIHIWRCRRS